MMDDGDIHTLITPSYILAYFEIPFLASIVCGLALAAPGVWLLLIGPL